MTSSIELIFLPLKRHDGQEQSDLPGLRLAVAPRRAARGRSSDQLGLHLTLDGTAPLGDTAMSRLLDSLVETYYKTSGSSTTAMQAVADVLNEYLLGRNMRGQARGMQSYGLFTMVVLRGDQLYLGQSAGAQATLIQTDGVQHLADASAGRGLGAGRVSVLRFRQARLSPGDALVICPFSPSAWTAAMLSDLHSQPLEVLHQRLIQRAGPQLEAVVVQARAGEGGMQLVRPKLLTTARPRAAAESTPPPVPPGQPAAQPTPEPASSSSPPPQKAGFGIAKTAAVVTAPAQPEVKPEKAARERQPMPIGPLLRRFFQALAVTIQHAAQSLQLLIRRMLPDESLFNLPSSVMAFIALAVPIFVVAIAMLVYVNQSRDTLYAEFMSQARSAYDQSVGLEDPLQIRQVWDQVLAAVNQAEVYRITDETRALRAQAYSILDDLDVVQRLNFNPALVRDLPEGVVISRLVVTMDNELYLLNANGGNVYRATFTGSGYEIDPEFACGPVPQPLIVGPLVDIAALPLGYPTRATIMGMDGDGNLLQCIPGESPLAFQLGPPDAYWGEPLAFDLDGSDLYVLDPLTNAVWIYNGYDDEYRQSPTLFFGTQVPPMQDVIDLSVIGNDLFLLHADGHLTLCVFNIALESPTRCTDPVEYTDKRQGYGNAAVMADTHFTEIQDLTRPEISLYLLDQEERAIFFFSRRLAMQHQYRPANLLPEGEITAFYVGENRLAFLAIGHQVFFAQLP